jgi:hypothetical protein
MKHRGIWATVYGVFFCIFGNESVFLEQQSHFGNCAGLLCGMGPAMGVPFAAKRGGGSIPPHNGDEADTLSATRAR